MNLIRILSLLLLLLSSNGYGLNFPSESVSISEDQEYDFQFSEDIQELSYSNLVSPVDLFSNKIPSFASFITIGENSKEISRSKRYLSSNHLIEPGLKLKDIIFPFHSFL